MFVFAIVFGEVAVYLQLQSLLKYLTPTPVGARTIGKHPHVTAFHSIALNG